MNSFYVIIDVDVKKGRKGLKFMKIKDGYVLRQVAGNSIVIAVGDEALNFNGIITINGAGTFLWEKLINGADKDTLLRAMLSEYDIDETTASADIDEFLLKLKNADLLTE